MLFRAYTELDFHVQHGSSENERQTQRLMYSVLTHAHSPPHSHSGDTHIYTYVRFVDVSMCTSMVANEHLKHTACMYRAVIHHTLRYTYSIVTDTSCRICKEKTT